MKIEYGVAKYNMRDAAVASGFSLNTLRSLYGREHFRIIGGEAKKGRGVSADLTLEDIMCIAVAKVAVDAGVHPKIAFNAGMEFAYTSDRNRNPACMFPTGFTVLILHPAVGASAVVNMTDTLSFADLFGVSDPNGRPAAVALLVNFVERNVFSRLGALHALDETDGGNATSQDVG